MSLIHLPDPADLRLSTVSARVFGQDNWGKVGGADLVLEGPDTGAGARFADGDIARSFRSVFVEGAAWRDTPFFANAARRIAEGTPLWRCTTPEALERRLETDIRALFASMKAYGFLSQQQIAGRLAATGDSLLAGFAGEGYHAALRPGHNLKVGINEDGVLLFLDGRHRLAVALALGLTDIPARVVFRHARWHALRQSLAARHQPGAEVGFAHPDLAHLRLAPDAARSLLAPLPANNRLGAFGLG